MKSDQTLIEVYRDIKSALQDVSDQADVEAVYIITHVLGLKREDIVLSPGSFVENEKADLIKEILGCRKTGRPLSNIFGEKEFWGRVFKTTSDTLDPRADSETLIRAAKEFFPDRSAPLEMLDIGTGTGCLIVTLLCEYQNAKGTAIDISKPAIDIAKANAQKYGAEKRIEIIQQSWADLASNKKYDLVISNPPYISRDEELEKSVTGYDPHVALYADHNGLKAYEEISDILPNILNDDGIAVFEIGLTQANDVTRIFEKAGMVRKSLFQDLAKRDRCLVFTKA